MRHLQCRWFLFYLCGKYHKRFLLPSFTAAQRAHVTYLVTNDTKLILHSPVAALTPEAAIKLLDE